MKTQKSSTHTHRATKSKKQGTYTLMKSTCTGDEAVANQHGHKWPFHQTNNGIIEHENKAKQGNRQRTIELQQNNCWKPPKISKWQNRWQNKGVKTKAHTQPNEKPQKSSSDAHQATKSSKQCTYLHLMKTTRTGDEAKETNTENRPFRDTKQRHNGPSNKRNRQRTTEVQQKTQTI